MKKTKTKKSVYLKTIFKSIAVAAVSSLLIFAVAKAAPPLSPYSPGETLDPNCAPGDTNCTIVAPAVSGSNSDITSLSGLTAALSVGQGGTGLSTIAADKLLYSSALDTLSSLSLDSTLGISSGILSVQDNSITGAKIALGSDAQGDIMYYSGTDWARLGAGASGQYLQTQGAGADPQWTTGATSIFGRTGDITAQANDYTWDQINKTTSSLADITTRSAGDLSSGNLGIARMPLGGAWDITSDLNLESNTLFVGNAGGSYAGRVGVGTASPEARLHVVDNRDGIFQGLLYENLGTGSAFVSIHSQDTGGDAVLGWGIEPTKASWHLGAANSDGLLKVYQGSFGSGGLTTVFNAGRMGIGTAPASGAHLHVYNLGSPEVRIDTGSASSYLTKLTFYAGGTQVAGIYGDPNGTMATSLGFRVGNSGIQATLTPSLFSTTVPISATTSMYVSAGGWIGDTSRTIIRSLADGDLKLSNHGETTFGKLQFGGTTSSFPALAVNGSDLQVIRADGSTNANLLVTGSVGIGTATPTDTLHIAGNVFTTAGLHIGADADANLFDDGSNGAGSTTMYIGNASINVTASDVRLKENINPSTINALSIIDSMPVVDFDWKDGTKWFGRGRATGLIAQDMYDILPQVVDKPADPNNIWSVEYQHIVPYLIKGMQELTDENKVLTKRIETLETMMGNTATPPPPTIEEPVIEAEEKTNNVKEEIDPSAGGNVEDESLIEEENN